MRLDPYEDDRRPRIPKIVFEAIEEGSEGGESFWQALVKSDEDLQRRVREKEKDFEGLGTELDKSLDDIL